MTGSGLIRASQQAYQELEAYVKRWKCSQYFWNGWVENIRHFRSLTSLTSGQLWSLDRQGCVRQSTLHNWLQFADENVFLMKGKLDLDNMEYSHQVHFAVNTPCELSTKAHACSDNTCENVIPRLYWSSSTNKMIAWVFLTKLLEPSVLHLSAACGNHVLQFNFIQSGGEKIKSQMIKLKAAPLDKSMYLVSQGWRDHKE